MYYAAYVNWVLLKSFSVVYSFEICRYSAWLTNDSLKFSLSFCAGLKDSSSTLTRNFLEIEKYKSCDKLNFRNFKIITQRPHRWDDLISITIHSSWAKWGSVLRSLYQNHYRHQEWFSLSTYAENAQHTITLITNRKNIKWITQPLYCLPKKHNNTRELYYIATFSGINPES